MAIFPVFGEDGEEGELGAPSPRTPDGFRPLGQQAPSDNEHFHFRDPVREATQVAERTDQLFFKANPELYRARQALVRAMRTATDYVAKVNDLTRLVAAKSASMG